MPAERLPFHKRFLRFRWLLLINLVLVTFLGMSLGREYMRSRDIQTQIDELTAQAEALQAHNLELTELATAFQTESYLEREARLKLGLKKPGETVVIVQEEQGRAVSENDQEKANPSEEPSSDPRAALTEEQDALLALANPWKWWYYFFDQPRYQQIFSYGRTGTTAAY